MYIIQRMYVEIDLETPWRHNNNNLTASSSMFPVFRVYIVICRLMGVIPWNFNLKILFLK